MKRGQQTTRTAQSDWRAGLGEPLANPGPWQAPSPATIEGRYCTLIPLDLDNHADELWAEMIAHDPGQRQWQYLAGMGPFDSQQDWVDRWRAYDAATDNLTFAVRLHETGRMVGQFSLLRIRPVHGSAEVGFVRFPPQMQRTRASTEAQYLLAEYILGTLGYRRYEWKCNADNKASMATATRLGFRFEGIFRNDMVNHGRNRDTAWFSIIDTEWPTLKAGYQRWLTPENFDALGRQRARLSDCFV